MTERNQDVDKIIQKQIQLDDRDENLFLKIRGVLIEGVNILSTKIDEVSPSGHFHNTQISHTATQVDIISNDTLEEAMSKIEWLVGELSAMKEKFRNKSNKLRDSEGQLRLIYDENKKLKKKEASLREIILQGTTPVQISDAEMTSLFGVVHQKIQAVSHSRLFDLDARRYKFADNMAASTQDFYHTLGNSNKMERNGLIQAEIYTQIHDLILDSDIFGLGQALNTENRVCAEQDFLESSMQRMEQFLKCKRVAMDAIADWRLATIKCVGRLARTETIDIRKPVTSICEKLSPLFQISAKTQDINAFWQDVAGLCVAAYNLRLLMRKAKAAYYCHILPRGTQLEAKEDLAEIYGVEGGETPSSEVAYTLTGALLKDTGKRDEEPIVLEKAQVVVKSA